MIYSYEGFFFLFRLEKVYNLVKEAMPKKPDGQSGVEGIGWGKPHQYWLLRAV